MKIVLVVTSMHLVYVHCKDTLQFPPIDIDNAFSIPVISFIASANNFGKEYMRLNLLESFTST